MTGQVQETGTSMTLIVKFILCVVTFSRNDQMYFIRKKTPVNFTSLLD